MGCRRVGGASVDFVFVSAGISLCVVYSDRRENRLRARNENHVTRGETILERTSPARMKITLRYLVQALHLDVCVTWQAFWIWRAWANTAKRPAHAEPKGVELCAAVMLALKLRASEFLDVGNAAIKSFKKQQLYAAELQVFGALISQGATETPWDYALQLERYYACGVSGDTLSKCAYALVLDDKLRANMCVEAPEDISRAILLSALCVEQKLEREKELLEHGDSVTLAQKILQNLGDVHAQQYLESVLGKRELSEVTAPSESIEPSVASDGDSEAGANLSK